MPMPEQQVQGRLDDGTRVIFRPFQTGDRELLREGFERMSPESRYHRFFTPIEHLSEQQLDSLSDIDFVDRVAWLALLPDNKDFPGAGVARWVRATDDPEVAEAAVTVIDAYQRRGIGNALLRLLAQSAIERGIKQFRAFVLGENHAMLQLFESLGAETSSIEAGVIEMRIPLPANVDELLQTPAPHILRAAAEGTVEGRAGRPAGAPSSWGDEGLGGDRQIRAEGERLRPHGYPRSCPWQK